MKRNEIDSQLTWDLRFLFEHQEAFEVQFAQAQKEIGLLQASLLLLRMTEPASSALWNIRKHWNAIWIILSAMRR